MTIFTPATSANLGPGFDSLGLSMGYFNEATITPQRFTSISVKGEGEGNINLKKKNTFVHIFNEVYAGLTGHTDHFKFAFYNRIPFARGMGSSSSVIVGAIAAAHKMAGFEISKEQVLNRALIYENHPDNIAPAALGGFTANIVKNGVVHTKRAAISPDLRAVMVIPPFATSTKASRQALAKNISLANSASNLAHASFMTACFLTGDYESLRLAAVDKLHEEARMANISGLFKVREIAYKNGSLLSVLSGSGSSFLNVVWASNAERLRGILASEFANFRVEVMDFDNGGYRFND